MDKTYTFKEHFLLSIIGVSVINILAIIIFKLFHLNPLFGLIYFFQSLSHPSAASIGIIGGADGPTMIFVARGVLVWVLLPEILMVVIALVFYKPIKYFKSKSKTEV